MDLRKVICEKTNLVPCVHPSWVLNSFPVWAKLGATWPPVWGTLLITLQCDQRLAADHSMAGQNHHTKQNLCSCYVRAKELWFVSQGWHPESGCHSKTLPIAGPVKLGHNDEFRSVKLGHNDDEFRSETLGQNDEFRSETLGQNDEFRSVTLGHNDEF
jgi:hypothetical protein